MQSWTPDRVISLAPDAASATAGAALASAQKWASIGRSDRAIWGLCAGSGKEPYQARVDLSEPAFKCSCPSRKFPCKHGLGLLLLFAKQADGFTTQDEPAWVAEWIAGRSVRTEKKAQTAKAAAEKPPDVESQAKRAAQREARVRDGVAICRVWLEDLMRRGLAAAQTESPATWDRMAARLVDSQAPGIAGMVRLLPGLIASGTGWETRTLDHLGRLHLLLTAGEKLAELPTDLAGDVRTALGWTQAKEDALSGQGRSDRWVVLGQVVEEEDRLRVRRSWLVGRNTGQRALLLDFAAGPASFDTSIIGGTEFDGELAFYPGRLPLRALVKSRSETRSNTTTLGAASDETVEAGLQRYAEALSANPWLMRWPLILSRVRLVEESDRWFLVDAGDHALPVKPTFSVGLPLWRLLSASGGGETTVLTEWDGVAAQPLSAMHGSGFLDLGTGSAA